MTDNQFADVHSVYCYAHRVPHDHGIACHSTCPTCGGKVWRAEGEGAVTP